MLFDDLNWKYSEIIKTIAHKVEQILYLPVLKDSLVIREHRRESGSFYRTESICCNLVTYFVGRSLNNDHSILPILDIQSIVARIRNLMRQEGLTAISTTSNALTEEITDIMVPSAAAASITIDNQLSSDDAGSEAFEEEDEVVNDQLERSQ